MDLTRVFLFTCCFISVYGQFQLVYSSLTTAHTKCKLATPNVKFSLGRFTVEMPTDVLQDGEKAWIGYEKDFATFEYIGCSKAGRADRLYPLLSPNVGDCYFACKKYPVFGLREYGRTCQCFHRKASWTFVNSTCVSCGEFLCGDKGHTALYKPVAVPAKVVEEAIAFDQCRSYTQFYLGNIARIYLWEKCGSKHKVLCRNGTMDTHADWGTSNSKCQYPHSYNAMDDMDLQAMDSYWTANIRSVSITKLKVNTSPLNYKLFGYVERVNDKYMLKFTSDSSLTYLSVCKKDSTLTTKRHWITTTQSSVPSITSKPSVSTTQDSVSSMMVTQSNIQSFIPTTTQSDSFTQHTTTMFNSLNPRTNNLFSKPVFLYAGVACAVLVIVAVLVTAFFIIRRRRSGRKKHNSSLSATDNVTYDNHTLDIYRDTNQIKLCNNTNSALHALPSFNSTDDNDKVYSPDSREYSYSSIDNLYKNEYDHIILENDFGQPQCYNTRPELRRCMDPALKMVYDHLNSTHGMGHSRNNNEDYDNSRTYSHAVFGTYDYDTTVVACYKGMKLCPGVNTAHYDNALTMYTDNADAYDHTSAFSRSVVDNTVYDTTTVAHHKSTKLSRYDGHDKTLIPHTDNADEHDLVEATFGLEKEDEEEKEDCFGTTQYQQRNSVQDFDSMLRH